MNLTQLRYFDSLSRTEHFQRTAEEMGASQPSVSRAISTLERELGAPLFEQRGRNVVLSRYGRVFAGHIGPAMREIDFAVTRVREMSDPSKSNISISVNYTLANRYLPELLKSYLGLHGSRINYSLRQGNTPQILQDVLSGESELGICSFMEDQPEILFRPLIRRELRVAVPPGHPLAKQSVVSLRDVSRYPLVLSLDRTYYVENLFLRQGLQPEVACRLGEDHAIAGMVASGFGLAVIPYEEQLRSCGVELLRLSDDSAYRIFYLAISRGRTLSTPAKDFCRYLLDETVRTGALNPG